MQNLYKRYESKDYVLDILYDSDCESPRTSQDNLGTVVIWSRKHQFGDENFNPERNDVSPEDFVTGLGPNIELLPIYMLDHSGIKLRTTSFGDPWDSGQVGLIYCTKDDIVKCYGEDTEETRVKARNAMIAEIEELSLWLNGEAYGWGLYKKCPACGNKETFSLDSCFGYITADPEKTIKEALEGNFDKDEIKSILEALE